MVLLTYLQDDDVELINDHRRPLSSDQADIHALITYLQDNFIS